MIPVHEEEGWTARSPEGAASVKSRLEERKQQTPKSPATLQRHAERAAQLHQLHIEATQQRAALQNQRAKADRTASRTTVRLFESLIRLAQAHARLMARDVALLVDAVFAILIAESSMHTSPLLDINCIHSQFAEDPDGNYIELEERVLQMLGMDMA